MYQSRFGSSRDRAGRRRTTGAGREVWFGTQSMTTRMPRLVGLGDQPVEVVEGAEQRVDVAVVG